MQKEKIYVQQEKDKLAKDKEQYMNLNTELKNQSLKHTKKSQEILKKWEENFSNLAKENELLKSKQMNYNDLIQQFEKLKTIEQENIKLASDKETYQK